MVFVRADLPKPQRIAATVAQRVETPRRTTLRAGGASVEMVEHIMAALAGLRIDNCEVHVDTVEMPGCDGSSQPFVEALSAAGTVDAKCRARRRRRARGDAAGDIDSWIEARPRRGPGMSIKFRIDYGSGNAIGRQTLTHADHARLVSPRVGPQPHVHAQERGRLADRPGLGHAGPRCKDLLIFDGDGPIDNELRFRDECVRHKALDLVGDLALAGCDLVGHFVAHRSGHRLNAELVRVLLQEGDMLVAHRRSA